MAREKILFDLLPSRIDIGLSALIGLTGVAGQINISLEYVTGGTLEIVSVGASVGWGQGFIIPTNAILSFDTSGTIWLASSGATSTIMVIRGRGQGFEGAPA